LAGVPELISIDHIDTMNKLSKQHLIDPEICIRCHTCEATCPIEAITHDDNNVVVDAEICNHCMHCIPVCPTGSIDEWRIVSTPYSLDEQFEWSELPEQVALDENESVTTVSIEALDDEIASLLADAHSGAGGQTRAPASALKPSVNMYKPGNTALATVQGNYRLTSVNSDSDVRHIILDLGAVPFPVLEGQSVGIIAPGTNENGKSHAPRLYSVSSPRDGERANFNNLSLTVKREPDGVCSNYVCDLQKGDRLELIGPFGSTFLMPNDANARLLMICTGTGSAPFRAFTMYRERHMESNAAAMTLVFGARTPDSLPYFGPLKKVSTDILKQHLVFSRIDGQTSNYVQDVIATNCQNFAELIADDNCYLYICGLRAMEHGVEDALADVVTKIGLDWTSLKGTMREQGRYHVETY